ncbi:LCP family protein [Liquorilactobacillus satsumensis]|uniref:LCP family glycopolymer transferase n=1 Tax=Liquorilactobacillus TaxID=2767888 RepID=UPI0021C33D37|nr:LCP family protein [Liquorilactobacillus satsumensis]MCP9311696.1 LCP family protein [Liquorilactobacillus satsumensis]MCP9358829.1 LCP family protein [Liquorilactobacillus satsumensis]
MAKDTIKRHHHHRKGKRKIWKYLIAFLIAFFAIDALVLFKMYNDAKQAVNVTYKKVKHDSGRNNAQNLKEGKPFSILLLGTDTGEYGRTYTGRSDTIMVVVVNPKTKTTTLASIPRDTKVSIIGHGFNNKLNAAYAYDGVSGAMNTIQSYLNVPIDHYIEMNMGGLVQLSSALGKIEVNNDLDFTNLGEHFPKGKVTIDKDNILAFTRMRYEDPRGDYGRQKRQREVLAGLVKKITTVNGIMKYQDILSALSSNMKTDITFEQMKTIASKYRKADQIKQIQLQGNGQTIDGVSYEVVPQANLSKVLLLS